MLELVVAAITFLVGLVAAAIALLSRAEMTGGARRPHTRAPARTPARTPAKNPTGDLAAQIAAGRVVLNPVPHALPPGGAYVAAIGNSPELKALDEATSAGRGCVNAPQLIDHASRSVTAGGFVARVLPAGTYIYKAFMGFVPPQALFDHVRAHPAEPVWLGDEYFVYTLARVNWGSMVAFKLRRPLILVDMYEHDNITRLLPMIRQISHPRARQIADDLAAAVGIDVTPADQLARLRARSKTTKPLYYYDRPIFSHSTYLHCGVKKYQGINPLLYSNTIFEVDKFLFKYILPKLETIDRVDGLIRADAQSSVESAGVTQFGEILIRGGAFVDALEFDVRHPYSWTSWRLDFVVPTEGVLFNSTLSKNQGNVIRPVKRGNDKFAIIKFIVDPPGLTCDQFKSQDQYNKTKYILFYNVHGFRAINLIDKYNPITIFGELIGALSDRLDMISCAEVPSEAIAVVQDLLARAGFKHFYSVPNGAFEDSLCLVCATRGVASFARVETPPGSFHTLVRDQYIKNIEVQRFQIVVNIADLVVAFVHLDIGCREVLDALPESDIINYDIRKFNSMNRVSALDKLLHHIHTPNMIIGDCNFTLNDNETEFLSRAGYVPTASGTPNSTPHNRVDHVFVKNIGSVKFMPNILLKPGFSDHTPLLQPLNRTGL